MKNYASELFHTQLTIEEKNITGASTRYEWANMFWQYFILPAITGKPPQYPGNASSSIPRPHLTDEQIVHQRMVEHFGQVLPIEEISELVRTAKTVVRMPCACRWDIEKKEVRCCYAISYGPEPWYNAIDMSYFGTASDQGLESLSADIALKEMEAMEDQGAIHTIWTMMTPFIGAICNCSAEGCLAMTTLSRIHVETMARAEYTARVDETVCNGCGLCDTVCHFNAIDSIMVSGRSVSRIDTVKCFGCGICRRACSVNAISLALR